MAAGRAEIAIIGAALDLGQGRRGVDMGPSAMRAAGLEERLRSLGYEVRDLGNVESPEPEATAFEDERARFLPEIKETCARIAALVAEASTGGRDSRSFSEETTRWRSELSAGWRPRTDRAGCSGSTRTPTSTRRRPARAGTSMAWRLPRRSASAGAEFESDAWPLPAVDPNAWR